MVRGGWGLGGTVSTTIKMVISKLHAPTLPSAKTAKRMAIESCSAQPRKVSILESVVLVCLARPSTTSKFQRVI
jgi:hypothetical protein